MSGVGFIEIILSILELFAKSGEKGKTQDSSEKVKKTSTIFREIKQRLLPYAMEVKETKIGRKKVGLSIVLKPEIRPPDTLDITIETKKFGVKTVKYLSMVGHCNFPTSYSVEFEPQDPVRDLVGDIGELKKIRIGDKEIDRKLIIRTNDKDLTINLFKDEEFKKYLDALYELQHFKISPGRITLVTINLAYTSYNVVNAYHLIKRVTGLLSFFSSSAKESITISYPHYEKTNREEKPPDEIPIMKTISVPKNLNESSTVTKVPDMKNATHVMFTLEDFKKEFTELQSLVTKIEFKPNQGNFNQVIVKPWISGITEIKYDLTSPMKVTGFGQRYSSPSKPIKFSVIKLKDTQQQYPTFSELKDAVKVTASDKTIEEDIQEKYELLRLVAQIKGLTNFVAECSSEKIIASLACELNPYNVKVAYDALIEAVNILKMII